MSRDSHRKSSVTRQILKEIISNESSGPATMRSNSSLELIKLNEAVSFLQRKIDRQYSEIKMLSDQLSREISLKEELAVLLGDERQKNAKTSQLLVNSNKQVVDLKKKILKLEKQEKGEGTLKDDYEIKLNKYRDIVRKKDELLTKNQQKVQEYLKNQRHAINLEQELKSLRDSFGRLKNREQIQSVQLQSLKKKTNDLQEKLKQKEEIFQEQQSALMFAQETIRRARAEYDELNLQSAEAIDKAESMQVELKSLIAHQQIQIEELTKTRLPIEKSEWSLLVYTNQLKRGLTITIKDSNLKRKVQKVVFDIIAEMQTTFNSILDRVMNP